MDGLGLDVPLSTPPPSTHMCAHTNSHVYVHMHPCIHTSYTFTHTHTHKVDYLRADPTVLTWLKDAQFCKRLKAIELHTLNGSIVWHVNKYVSVKKCDAVTEFLSPPHIHCPTPHLLIQGAFTASLSHILCPHFLHYAEHAGGSADSSLLEIWPWGMQTPYV